MTFCIQMKNLLRLMQSLGLTAFIFKRYSRSDGCHYEAILSHHVCRMETLYVDMFPNLHIIAFQKQAYIKLAFFSHRLTCLLT